MAVVSIDMLNFFAEEGDDSYRRRFSDVVGNICRIREMAERASVLFIHVPTRFESLEAFWESPMARVSSPHWIKGTREAEIVSELSPSQSEVVVPKTVNSAFYASGLDALINDEKVGRLLVMGVHTHVCVLLTAADAFYRNLEVVVVPECVTTIDIDRHVEGLRFIGSHLGELLPIESAQSLF